jgi:hypothetical protein
MITPVYLPRSIDAILLAWSRESDRKPLHLKVQMPEGELAYRLLSLPIYLAEKLQSLKSES